MHPGPWPELHPSRKPDPSFHISSLGRPPAFHGSARKTGPAGPAEPEPLIISCPVRKASSCLSGNPLSHPLPSKNESKSVVPFFSFFFPLSSLSLDLHGFIFFFPLHLNLAPQLKHKGKVSGDWRMSPRALRIRHPCLGRGSRFLGLPFWTQPETSCSRQTVSSGWVPSSLILVPSYRH